MKKKFQFTIGIEQLTKMNKLLTMLRSISTKQSFSIALEQITISKFSCKLLICALIGNVTKKALNFYTLKKLANRAISLLLENSKWQWLIGVVAKVKNVIFHQILHYQPSPKKLTCIHKSS